MVAAQNIPRAGAAASASRSFVARRGRALWSLAARFGQGWVTFGRKTDENLADLEDGLMKQAAIRDEQCERLGRDPADLDQCCSFVAS